MHQTFGSGHDLDESAEGRRALDSSFVGLANHWLCGDRLDHLTRSLHCLAADGCNRNQTGIVDSDLGASLFLDATYGLALRADEITDLLGVDCHRHNARSVRRQIGT